jgi:hypothetical protein
VGVVWSLLFLDVLGSATASAGLLHIPRGINQVVTQGSLWLALLLALTINPKLRLRPSIFLGLYSVLGVTSFMMSIRFVGLGTDYRAVRLLGFLAVLWLLTPWWGRSDLILLRSQVRFLVAIVASVVLGLALSPGTAILQGRLGGSIWPIPPTQVAHYSAELTGLTLLLWMCGLINRRTALVLVVPSFAVLLLTETRTALLGLVVGLVVACLSLFTANRRVRRAFMATIVLVAVILPLSPVIVNWLARGENSTQLTDLSGRTNFWGLVLAEQRPETNKILGNGLSNDTVDGNPIDSSWLSVYQDQGLVGDVLVGAMFLLLLLTAVFRPRGPARALGLFLVVYCVIASFTEDGAGIASQYTLDLAVAASLLAPSLPLRRILPPR